MELAQAIAESADGKRIEPILVPMASMLMDMVEQVGFDRPTPTIVPSAVGLVMQHLPVDDSLFGKMAYAWQKVNEAVYKALPSEQEDKKTGPDPGMEYTYWNTFYYIPGWGKHALDSASHITRLQFILRDISGARQALKLFGGKISPDVSQADREWFTKRFEGVHLSDKYIAFVRAPEMGLDSEGRVHAENGPALKWLDGLHAYSWHGRNVQNRAILVEPTANNILSEENVEIRRIMMERLPDVGVFLQEAGAKKIQQDNYGVLWEIPLSAFSATRSGWGSSGRPGMRWVQVENWSPEPDGTRRVFFLRVPPEMRTAKDAVAWTYTPPSDDLGFKPTFTA